MVRNRVFKKRRSRKKRLMPEMTLTPLIDTALTLLIIFMITAPMVQNGIKVDLPQGDSKEVANQQELVVTISKEGKMFFNSYPITKETLVDSVKKALSQNDELPVYLKADEYVFYGKVIAILDQLKFAGIKNVVISTRGIV